MCVSVRPPVRRLLLCITLLGALCLCWWAGSLSTPASGAAPSLSEAALQNQRALLSDYGWEVAPSPTCEWVTLPDPFPPSYEEYLRLQSACGFSLGDHAGETVLRCTYPVLNYPGWDNGVYADLLVLEGTVIGGDIRSAQLDGFLQSLHYPD